MLHKGDIGSADAEFDLFLGITAADIQRVAQTYFARESRIVITVTPKPAEGGVK